MDERDQEGDEAGKTVKMALSYMFEYLPMKNCVQVIYQSVLRQVLS